jgi:hypothetical protein
MPNAGKIEGMSLGLTHGSPERGTVANIIVEKFSEKRD